MAICKTPELKFKNRHVQSILASSKLRLLKLKKDNPVKAKSQTVRLETKDAVLEGLYTQKKDSDKLSILIHGWEGSSQSTYIQLLANSLFSKGNSSIFRLNFRDHGDTHHLNRELFHSCRIQEVTEAVSQVIQKFPHKRVYLMGFSLGGNFSLRVSSKVYNTESHNIDKVFAISPPINPKNSMIAIEDSLIYKPYFLRKWKKSLIKKQKLFPQDFQGLDYKNIKSLDKLTKMLIIQHTKYDTTDDYFRGYQITDAIIDAIETPTHIITAKDDPVIPYKDFRFLEDKKNINLITTQHGGHCGFINSWSLSSWIEDHILEELNNE